MRAASASVCAATSVMRARRVRHQAAEAAGRAAASVPTGARSPAPPARRARAQPAIRFGQTSVSIRMQTRGREMAQEAADHEAGVVGQEGLHARARHACRTARCRWRGRSASCGSAGCGSRARRASRASTSGSAARVSPTDTACTMIVSAPLVRPASAVEAEALAQVPAVARLLAAAPPQAAQHQRQRQPPHQEYRQAHQDCSSRRRAARDDLVDATAARRYRPG